jgi:hypothetical protein
MMLRRLLLCLLLIAAQAHAWNAQRLFEPEPVAVPRGLSENEVEHAVLDAAVQREWVIVSRGPGEMIVRYAPRDVSASVRIAYDSQSVRLTYAGSTNLDYAVSGGERYIHNNYNRWVQHLAVEILRNMLRVKDEHERSVR